MTGRQQAAFALGIAVGAAAVLLVLPGPRARLARLQSRTARVDSLDDVVVEAKRFGETALAKLRARYDWALREARQAGEQTEIDLWRRFDIARREGHLPPP